MSRMNPRIQELEVGIRSLSSVTFYPLSIHDQTRLSMLIAAAFAEFLDGRETIVQIEFIQFVIDTIQTNLRKIIPMVTDRTREAQVSALLKDMDNVQLVAAAELIFEQNYETSVKNGISLFSRAISALAQIPETPVETPVEMITKPGKPSLKRPSPLSSNATPDMDLNTSSPLVSGKGD